VVIASIVIASAVELVAIWAKKKNISRLPAVLSVYALVAIFLAGFLYFLFLPLLSEATDFLRNLPFAEGITGIQEALPQEGVAVGSGLFDGLDSFSIESITEYLNDLVSSFSRGVFSSISFIFGGVLSFILIVVLSFYLAVQEDGVGKFLRVIVPLKHEKYIIDLWRRSQIKIGLWIQGQLLLAAMVMILVYLGLLIIGVPHALLLAVLAGAFEIIPLFGPILAAIPALFVAFADGGTTMLLLVAGLYLVIQQFENHLMYPLVVKKVVGVPPMVSIAALVVGGQLAGFLGVLISVPVAAALVEFLSDVERNKHAQHAEEDLANASPVPGPENHS